MRTLVKEIITCIILFFCFTEVSAQTPVIWNVDKVNDSYNETISISGKDFGTNANDLRVFFGGVKAPISFASDQLIEVQVPSGTTFGRISVANITNGLMGFSSDLFNISYGGRFGLNASDFETQVDVFAERGLYDLCMCDFNNDDLNDIVTANEESNNISIFRNTSTIENISFVKSPMLINAPSINVNCGDLNGDGKPDLVVSEGKNGRDVFIFQNTTAVDGGPITFTSQTISLTSSVPRRLEINDLDGDGKPEIITTNPGGGNVQVLVNQSTLAAISFNPTPTVISVPQTTKTMGLAVEDVNGDDRPEIVLAQFLTDNGNCYVIQNNSTPGNIQLNNITELAIPGTIVGLKVGDLDGDGKPDIATTQLLRSAVSIFLNQSTDGAVPSFAAFQDIPSDTRGWGIDFGDLDGDGKLDIAIGSISTGKHVTILNNNSNPGNLQFQKLTITVDYINRNIKLGDIDGDAKPDITFTSIDDTNLGVLSSFVSVLRNTHCFVPTLKNDDPSIICSASTLRLNSTQAPGVTYRWQRNSDPPTDVLDPFLDITVGGNYTVTAISESGSCSEVSQSITVNTDPGAVPGAVTTGNNGPICVGETLNLTATGPVGATYEWTGPNNFTSTDQNPSIPNFTEDMVGKYSVVATVGNCVGQEFSTIVEAIEVPIVSINNAGASIFCEGATTTLSVENNANYTYQWRRDGADMTGENTFQLTVSQSGDYSVVVGDITVPTCSGRETTAVPITVLSNPIASFNYKNVVCVGESVSFTNQSTTDNAATVIYNWNFGDSGTSQSQNPNHSYASGGIYNVRLSIQYQGQSCTDELTQTIQVMDLPTVNIESEGGQTSICPGDSLRLSITGSFASVSWNTGENSNSIYVKDADTYSVDVSTSQGCDNSATFAVDLFPEVTVSINAPKETIKLGETLQLEASGLTDYTWSPADSIDNINISNPTINPSETTTYTVTGRNSDGCMGEASITIQVEPGKITDRINPHKLFSPNGDAIDDFWRVDDIQEFPSCKVTIYDQQGSQIFSAGPYLENWDATINGKPLPQGVYYYVINCGTDDQIAGSITVIR
ncbi:FG-GAP-like repeat-containing protein [Fulvivirgaceae bacterium BMA10]|uniref:FG-GAP-like repeat-containing protein n=1 Tax=Splendidivirga corallicola TaxID=3051826 RepID=A0ABT8KSN0_9BACT|nr:FG-GAP-like repeat-containing protein [Fulvivirgaceae bacterium BMA10]